MDKRTFSIDKFIERARFVHGDKYDYSKSVYINCDTKIEIICPIHGSFFQTPYNHCNSKQKCPKCSRNNTKKLKRGVGVNDMENMWDSMAYRHWDGMLTRCYSDLYHKKFPTYNNCYVCEDWKYLSRFYEWYNKNYIEGWCLDKDILVKGNKVYSPDTCCFVPNEINALFNKHINARGKYCLGVCLKRKGKYCAKLNIIGKPIHIGYFSTEIEAFNAYKEAKESYIKMMADKWKDKIKPKVYNAMYNYKVEITD